LFDNERRFKRKLRNDKKKIRTAFPDPDKSRLSKEAAELNVVIPGRFRILRASGPEWLLLTFGTIGSVIVSIFMPIFGFAYSEMFDVSHGGVWLSMGRM